jgi:hypothetical protein
MDPRRRHRHHVADLDLHDELKLAQTTNLISRRKIIVGIDAVGARLVSYQKQYAVIIINLLLCDSP